MTTFGSTPVYLDDRQFDFVPSDDKKAFTIAFSDLQVKVDEGDPALSSTAFSLILPLEGSTEERVEIEFAVTGVAVTNGGATATMMLSISGQSIAADFPTDVTQDLDQRVTFTAEHGATECRVSVFLLVGRDSPSAAAFLNLSTIDAEFLPRPVQPSSD